ncbi:MAG: hypothetical protein CVU64_21080 [Deltaproteobacteria bacterium HGW-Deltaproteobacteria-21]|nr:MAG: hypothetical protein CVU64_21080 [Deltaproteobacteria bacterium HGW-Deltaproteobacteria-21]
MHETGCKLQDTGSRIHDARKWAPPRRVGLQAKRGECDAVFGSRKEWAPLEEGGAHLFPEKTSGNRESEGDRNGTITLLQVQ